MRCVSYISQFTLSVVLTCLFMQTTHRRKKGKKEFAVHYVKEGPIVDTTSTEPQYDTVTEPQYTAGVQHGYTVCVYMPILQSLLFINF